MKLSSHILAVMLLALIIAACQAPAPPTLTDADTAAIRASNASYATAVKAKDWAALAALYAQDAVILPPNHRAVEGRASIQAYFSAFPPMSAFELQIVELDGRGDLAFVRGTYTLTVNPEGAPPVTDTGNWLEIRRKQSDGSWTIYRDTWNSDVAGAQ
jgi:uncharacterized protein (TIGR02246 family)